MITLLVDGGLAVASWMASGTLRPFVSRVLRARESWGCDATIVAWDAPRDTTWRRELSPAYKAKRPPSDGRLAQSLNELRDDLPCLDIAQASAAGAEADDVLYTLSRTRVRSASMIYSSDKDMLQAVAPGVGLLKAGKIDTPITYDTIKSKTITIQGQPITGLDPAGWRDLLTLAGDPTDGVSGLRGVGPRKAHDLLTACPDFVRLVIDGDHDRVRESCSAHSAVAARWVERAICQREELRLSLSLVNLRLVDVEYVDAEPDEERAAAMQLGSGGR